MKEDVELSSSVLAGRFKRIKQFIWLAQLVIVIVIASNYFAGVDYQEMSILVAAFVINLGSLVLLHWQKYTLSASILLLNGTFVITSLMFINNGLRDSAIIALPGILVIAAVVGSSRLFYWLLGYLVLFIFGLGYYDIEYNSQRVIAPMNWSVVADIIVLMLVTGFALKQLVNELKKVTNKLTFESQQAQENHKEIEYLAHHDALTGLPNRNLAQDRFQQSLAHVTRTDEAVALLFIDLDDFKPVNDNLGHDIGDLVLKEVAVRLTGAVRKQDSICRIGGDEFVIILESCDHQNAIAEIANKILESVRKPYHIHAHQIQISASIGVSLAPHDGVDFDELSKKADLAMYKSKASGRNSCSFFDEDLNQELIQKNKLIDHLRNALVKRSLELHFQPVYDLMRDQILSVEALLRCRYTDDEYIDPDVFIPLAEESGMINEIGKRVLTESCRQCMELRRNGYPLLTVSVNISSHQLRDNSLEQTVLNCLRETGLPAHALTLEIKESALQSKFHKVADQVATLRNFGVKICIDDYGFGHSNLTDLHNLGVESVKLDRRLLVDMVNDPYQQKMLAAILSALTHMGISVVAKGVMDERFMAVLTHKHCPQGQGFHLAPPVSMEDLKVLLQRTYH